MSLKVKATLFLLLCLVLPALSKNIYIKYDAACMDRYEYRLNGNTTGGGLIAYYLKGASGKKIMLEVGIESIKRVKVAPKGTQSCKWVTVKEKLAQDINAERHQVFIVRKIGSIYTVSPVHLATYFQTKPNDGIYVSGNAYNFEYQNQTSGYIPNDLAGPYSTSKFIYTGAADVYCERAYTIKEIPIETCKPTTDLRIIPGIGIIEERKDIAPFSTEQNVLVLTRINGQTLQDYLSRKCNPPTQEVITYQTPAPPTQEVITYQTPAPPPPPPTIITTPVEYEVVYQEVPVEYQPAGAELLFQHKSPPPVVEKFVPEAQCEQVSTDAIHIVQRQETLFGIARKYNLNVQQLRSWNKLDAQSTVYPCMELKILPNPTEAEVITFKRPEVRCTQVSSPGIHVLQPEETLARVANIYGISLANLRAWNGLSATDVIRPCALLITVAPKKECDQQSYSGVHIVQAKENITEIARIYGISIDNIRQWNQLNKEDIIRACTALKVAAPLVAKAPVADCPQVATPGIHIVQAKQSVTEIAKIYGISVDNIRQWNKLKRGAIIRTCTALKVAAPPVNCTQVSTPGIHVVQAGETLQQIAERYWVTVNDIRKWNKLSSNNTLRACEALKVAEENVKCSEVAAPGHHIVQYQENLTAIANRYGVSIEDIRKWNNIDNKHLIRVCSSLKVTPPTTNCDRKSSRGIHIIRANETLLMIAHAYNISIVDLKRWNNIKDSDVIKTCTALIVAPNQPASYDEVIVAPCQTKSYAGVHIVQPRETLIDISERYYVSVNDLREWNNLGASDIIRACTALKVVAPQKAPAVVAKSVNPCSQQSSSGVHVIQPRETLNQIAARYFISVNDIRRWNNLGKSDIIHACTALRVIAPQQNAPQVIKQAVNPCSQQSSAGVHVIQPKETLNQIAARYFISVDDLRRWNNLGKSDIIHACTALQVTEPARPQPQSTVDTRISPCNQRSSRGVHIVQPKETLTEIADRYFVSVDDIRRWNQMGTSDIIRACTSLRVSPPTSTEYQSKGVTTTCAEKSSLGRHIVQSRETLIDIAERYFVTVNDLRKWNNLGDDSDIIQPCTAIRVGPQSAYSTDVIATYNTQARNGIHVVQPKETLSAIAKRYGVSVEDLRKWNKLGTSNVIQPYSSLKVMAPKDTMMAKSVGAYSPQSTPGVHVVHPAETLSAIAERYAVSVDDLKKWNNLGDSDVIQPSTALIVAAPKTATSRSANPQEYSSQSTTGVHIVQPTETLSAIAKRYGISVDDLKKWNNLGDSDIIRPATSLIVAAPTVKNAPTRATQSDGSYSPQSTPGVHIIHSGENLSAIANRYAVSVDDLKKWNNLGDSDVIKPATSLIVAAPRTNTASSRGSQPDAYSPQATRGVHVVHPGENLSAIANRYAVSVDDLKKWNKLGDSDVINPSTSLIVAAPRTNKAPSRGTASDSYSPQSTRGMHVVHPGENLSTIAKRYAVSVDDLKKWNKLGDSDVINPSTSLIVAAPQTKVIAPAATTTAKAGEAYSSQSTQGIHTIHPGENLSTIAKRYAVSVDDLRKWNKLGKSDVIQPGTALIVAPPADRSAMIKSASRPASAAAPCSNKSSSGIHVIQSKETLTDIARQYFVSVDDLRKWNKLTKSDIIQPCTALKVVAPTTKCPKSSYAGTHIVQQRETLTSIARRYAVGIPQLRQWNNLSEGDPITVCTALKVVPPKNQKTKKIDCAEKSSPGIHIVQSEENLSLIAQKYGVSIAEIRAWNKLDQSDIIIPCARLRIAAATPSDYTTATKCKTNSYKGIHVVQAKETISSIARIYSVSVANINLWNNLGKADVLQPCSKLKVAPPPGVSANSYKVDAPISTANSNSNDGQLTAKGGNIEGWLAGNCLHIVKTGETLTSISLLYGFTTDRFRYFNDLPAGEIIKVGQQLKTSDCGCGPEQDATSKGATPYDTTTKVHVVQNKETLTSIAAKYHITVEKLQSLNQLEKGEVIFPFMNLYVQ